MKVLDATFLIDYLEGVAATREFYEANGGAQTRWVVPVPSLAEVLVGEGNLPNGDVDEAHADLAWVDVHPVDERTAITAGQIADEIAPNGPYLDGHDALIAAVGREPTRQWSPGRGPHAHRDEANRRRRGVLTLSDPRHSPNLARTTRRGAPRTPQIGCSRGSHVSQRGEDLVAQ